MKDRKYKNTLKTIIRMMKYICSISTRNFIVSFFLTVLVGFTSGISLWATRLLINGILLDGISNESNFMSILIVYAAINILIQLIQSMNNYLNSKNQLNIDYGISMDIITKAKELGLGDFENSEVYNVLSRANTDGRIKLYLTYRNILSVIIQIISMISIATIILSWNSYVFLLVFVTPIISTIVNTKIEYRNYKMKMERINEVRRTSYINFLLTNNIACKEIKTYNIGSYLVNIFSNIKKKIRSQDLGIVRLRSLWSIGLGFFEEIISLFVIFRVVNMATEGKILIGDTVAYIDSLGTIQSNVGGFLNSISEIYNDVLYVEEYFKLLDLEKNEYIDRQIKIDEIKEIEFRNVYFSYDNSSNFNLRDINIKISKGELIGIVGGNGSGKTSFIKILCGFYDNYKGQILVNGIELMKINPDSLRDRMGTIFQDFNQ